VVGQACDGEEACRLYEQLRPDILILDLRMPKKDGLEVVTELMAQRPRPRIVVLTNSPKAEDLRRALSAGAKGYLLKGAESEEVWQTIREVYAGKSSLPHEMVARLAESMAQPALSQRELQVLKQVALGKSNKEIGQVLYISEHTVKNHLTAILKSSTPLGARKPWHWRPNAGYSTSDKVASHAHTLCWLGCHFRFAVSSQSKAVFRTSKAVTVRFGIFN